ncbi:hypothetical protein AWB67_07503 [Caballeronia terrestris]|uniref:Uncharacterized protein n=1 Tax=Caballeronia terrestris TaxID=1226301 RepID=A0A158L3J2_9BURK|nr:hypothetical protein AWB67_07503 [Caballeronia terrestris]
MRCRHDRHSRGTRRSGCSPYGLRSTNLALLTGQVLPLLDETSLIHDESRFTFAQLFNNIFPQYIARSFGNPLCPLEKMLRAVKRRFADPFGELPAVFTLDREFACDHHAGASTKPLKFVSMLRISLAQLA